MKLKSAILLAALTLCAGCAKKEAPADTAASANAANAAVSAAPSAAPAATADTTAADTAAAPAATAANTDPNHIPVTTDYEDQAQKDVSASNVSAKLDDLEKEINSK